MWFDVQQALAELEGGAPPPSVQPQVLSSAEIHKQRVAVVASVATPPAQKPKIIQDIFNQHSHGVTFMGQPKIPQTPSLRSNLWLRDKISTKRGWEVFGLFLPQINQLQI